MAEDTITKISLVDPIQVNVAIPNFEGKAGRDGTDGRDGDDAYRVAVRNGFVGTEQEWLDSLKGGKPSTAEQARNKLLENNVWCDDSSVDSVLLALIGNWGNSIPRPEYKPLRLDSTALVGNPDVIFDGEPHYKVQIDGTTVEFDTNGKANVTLPSANTGDSYTARYLGYTDTEVSTLPISFGDLSAIFRKGNLIETTTLTIESKKIMVSVYDNKLVEIAKDPSENNSVYVDQSTMSKIKDYVLTKVSDIETLIVSPNLMQYTWDAFSIECFEEIAKGIGHGVNINIDITVISHYGRSTEKLFDEIRTNDRRGKYYIGKAIQVKDSNVLLLKDGMREVKYNFDTNQIAASNQ